MFKSGIMCTWEEFVMNTKNITNYKPKDFADLLGVSVKTLQRWDREGILKANRTPTDRRYYTYDQYLQFKGIQIENDIRDVVIYARVSTRNQKDDLQNQVEFLKQFCNAKGMIVNQCIEDFGSGLNYNRKNWNKLLDEVMENKIKTIVISNKDRFIRFGYEWFILSQRQGMLTKSGSNHPSAAVFHGIYTFRTIPCDEHRHPE